MASAAWSARSQAPARGFMAEYQFIVDDGRSVDLGIETVDAMDNEEAELLARMRWASSPPSAQRRKMSSPRDVTDQWRDIKGGELR